MHRLDLGTGLRVLALGAHPDDIEIGCGGTLLRLLAEGRAVHVDWVVVTGTPERRQEARASAGAYAGAGGAGVTLHFPDQGAFGALRDGFLPYAGARVKEVMEHLKASLRAPDLILCPWRHDAHQDHRLLAELVANTWRDSLVWEYEIPKYDGDLRTPNLYVTLDRPLGERKVELLAKHFPSQAGRRWFTPDTFWALLRLRGVECNAPSGYAEGFHARKVAI